MRSPSATLIGLLQYSSAKSSSSSTVGMSRLYSASGLRTLAPMTSSWSCCSFSHCLVGVKGFHWSSQLAHPRFKLKREKCDPAPAVALIEQQHDEGMDDEQGYLKSHPYRKLSQWKSKSQLAQHLVDNVIYFDHGLFVTNKPFGVGVRKPGPKQLQQRKDNLHLRGLELTPYTLEDVVPELAYLLNKPTLCLVRSTEKLTSGVAVFAEDETIAERFSKRVASSKIHFDTLYKYHVITVLPPLILHPEKVERIGVTVKQPYGTDVKQSVLLPEYSINSVKRREVVSVHCQMSLVKPGHSTGYLVELNTSSVANNFLRLQCANKLAPILGDHLYSSRVQTLKGIPAKIDPTHLIPGTSYQKLTREMQECLQLKRPEDSLFVPTHSHLRSYKVRNFLPGRAVLHLVAPYPPHFKWTCKQLGIMLEALEEVEVDEKWNKSTNVNNQTDSPQ